MLASNEIVVRATVVPKMVLSGVISPAKALSDFSNVTDRNGNRVYTISVGRKSMLPTDAAVHDYGCRVAAAQNAAIEDRAGRPLKRGEETQHYRGSYSLPVGPIEKLSSAIFDIAVRHVPLANLDEHCDIEMRRTAMEFRKIEISAERTDIISQLRLLLSDPIEHICDCDVDLRDKLELIRLIAVDRTVATK